MGLKSHRSLEVETGFELPKSHFKFLIQVYTE